MSVPLSGVGSAFQAVPDWVQNNAHTLVTVPLQILVVLLVAVGLRLACRKLIDRAVQRMVDKPLKTPRRGSKKGAASHSGQARERRRQRAKTIGSVLRSSASIVIFTIAGVIILGEIGVDIAPIIASAGIAGLAFGFGAQSLVSDFISGLFMLMEDQYGVGDWVDIDGTGGTVEEVGLRVTKLRDMEGAVWYVRNGQILKIGNYSQDWACAVLEVPVAYEQDLDAAEEAIEKAAWSLWEDPEWRDHVIDSPQIWGITSLAREAVVLRVSVNTTPLRQWAAGRELRRRIKEELDKRGIEIPLMNQQVVKMPGGGSQEAPRVAPLGD
jgi:small conductance mechanosensitive channel